jgi:hypothetical protein
LATLPADLKRQADVMRRLLAEVQTLHAIRLYAVGCSIGRGTADRYSDIDAYLGVTAEAWPAVLEDIDDLLPRLGILVDSHHHMLSVTDANNAGRHTFGQYADGVQLDLLVGRAAVRSQPRPDWVVLYDPDERVTLPLRANETSLGELKEWMYGALVRLSYCAKYLARDSLWEALTVLEAARMDLWRLWCAARGVADPQWAITSLNDSPETPLPPDIAVTAPRLEAESLWRAAIRCLDLVIATWPDAAKAVGDTAVPVPPLAAHVSAQLADLLGRRGGHQASLDATSWEAPDPRPGSELRP